MVRMGAAWGIRFSPRTVLAVNGAVAIASRRNGRDVHTTTVAKATGAGVADLSSILKDLGKAGLVRSDGDGSVAWGSRPPADVSLYDIARAVGERFRLHCSLRGNGSGAGLCGECPIKCLSASLESEVIGMFKARRLSELLPIGA